MKRKKKKIKMKNYNKNKTKSNYYNLKLKLKPTIKKILWRLQTNLSQKPTQKVSSLLTNLVS